jgi:LEA14-like dessication related protein
MEPLGRIRAFGRPKTLALVAVILAGSVGGAFALGVVGTPAVESAENRFTGVSTETTTVETALVVNNPNPIGVQLGDVGIDYTVFMNDVAMAEGSKDGLSLGRGNSTVPFTTAMDNGQIPPWWVSHIQNGERTQVTIDADVRSSLVGGRSVSLTQNRTVETEIIEQFNSTETRPVNTDSPIVSDPALYINATRGSWDQSNVTQSQTPLNVEFDVHNPKAYPYTVTEIGYTARMNDITVGNGSTERGYVIAPGETQTVGVDTVIRNENLDEWWVSHLQNNQVTEVYIDFYLVVDTGSEQFRIDLDAIDYENTIETDIFGNKADYPTGDGTTDTGGETEDGSGDTDDGDSVTDTVTGNDGVLSGGDDGSVTDTPTGGDDTTTENTPTTDGTATDDGGVIDL